MESGALNNLPLLFRSDFLTHTDPARTTRQPQTFPVRAEPGHRIWEKPSKENLQTALTKKRMEDHIRGLVSHGPKEKNLY